ncbi:MAG: superoxide dismutase [Bacteroidaceae bacterium]|nr:superoxide dismutase [Bacteroidaceae bacterium]
MNKFELMTLPYEVNALEPIISRETIGFHHGKHLAAYVNNLNSLLPGSGFEEMSLEEIVCKSSGGILNNAGQILNHELYFGQFAAPKENNVPTGKIADAIVCDFGSFEAFKEAFQKGGATLFGSGWVWLSADKDGKLVITQEPNAANPIQKGLKPLLTFDVWEHAYYLDYQNRRPDHLAALWQIIDWKVVNLRFSVNI